MDDSQIIALFFDRSEQAIPALAEKYGSLCHRVAGNFLSDRRDVEECVSDAYLGVWNTVPPQRPDPLASYLCRIVRNLAVKRYHANTAEKRNGQYDLALEELEGVFSSAASVEQEADARELTRCINRFLETQDRESRVLFVRRYWYADSVEDLARSFGISPHAVSVRLSRIRARLRRCLVKEGFIS